MVILDFMMLPCFDSSEQLTGYLEIQFKSIMKISAVTIFPFFGMKLTYCSWTGRFVDEHSRWKSVAGWGLLKLRSFIIFCAIHNFDKVHVMITSSGARWIPRTKGSDAEPWRFLWSAFEPTNEQTVETPMIWDTIALIMTPLQWQMLMFHTSATAIFVEYERVIL